MTEGGGSCILYCHLHPTKLHTVGQPSEGHEIRLIDDQGRVEVPRRQARPTRWAAVAGMMNGYHNQPGRTLDAEWHDAQGNRFIRTGDVGRFDADGFVDPDGPPQGRGDQRRLQHLPQRPGAELRQRPAVADVAVVGVPATNGARRRWRSWCAVRADDAPEALRSWMNQRVGKTRRPTCGWWTSCRAASSAGAQARAARRLRHSLPRTLKPAAMPRFDGSAPVQIAALPKPSACEGWCGSDRVHSPPLPAPAPSFPITLLADIRIPGLRADRAAGASAFLAPHPPAPGRTCAGSRARRWRSASCSSPSPRWRWTGIPAATSARWARRWNCWPGAAVLAGLQSLPCAREVFAPVLVFGLLASARAGAAIGCRCAPRRAMGIQRAVAVATLFVGTAGTRLLDAVMARVQLDRPTGAGLAALSGAPAVVGLDAGFGAGYLRLFRQLTAVPHHCHLPDGELTLILQPRRRAAGTRTGSASRPNSTQNLAATLATR